MAGCCDSKHSFDGLSRKYKQVLYWIIAINALMFIVEMSAGIGAQSQALQADALDFLADTLTYALSLWVIGKAIAIRSNIAILKGISLLIMAFWVFSSTVYRIFVLNSPEALTMGTVAIAACAANLICVYLLREYKDGDANVRSVWLCSRNDAIGNVVVVIAAFGVWGTDTPWPDLLVALFLAVLFLSSAWQILKQGIAEKRAGESEKLSDVHSH